MTRTFNAFMDNAFFLQAHLGASAFNGVKAIDLSTPPSGVTSPLIYREAISQDSTDV